MRCSRDLLLLSLFAALQTTVATAAPKPNILFIMVDEMKWNVMSCAGHTIVTTPNLDRLAHEGTRFSSAFTVAPICTPSRYSFFTGRYAHVHGATDNSTPTREPQVLLPAILKQAGYQTAISGKLHFIPNNLDYQFDYFRSFASEGPHRLSTWLDDTEQKYGHGAARRLALQPFPDDPLGRDLGKLTYPKEDSQTFWITDRAVDFLKQRDKDKPFFLFVSYLDPHSPSHLCDPYWKMFDAEKMPLPASFKPDTSKSSATASNRHEVNDPKIVQAMTAAYFAKVKMVDDNIGRLLDQLHETGLDDNTVIVFTADHGNMLGDLNRWFKGAMYEGSTRIPLLMKAPTNSVFASTFNRGAVVSNLIENIDVMPTLCEMAGIPLPQQGIQGRSFTKLVAGTETQWKDHIFAERVAQMVRTPHYKFIHNPRKGDTDELYDLIQDPLETNNIIANAACATVAKQFSEQLKTWQTDIPPVPIIEGVPPLAVTDQPRKNEKKKRKKQP